VAERRPPVGNLPEDLTDFVGRSEELGLARRLLSQSRLVTLTGVGGGLSAGQVLDALAGLIDKSVLVSAQRDGVLRYWTTDHTDGR
jgi:hypothetical protein